MTKSITQHALEGAAIGAVSGAIGGVIVSVSGQFIRWVGSFWDSPAPTTHVNYEYKKCVPDGGNVIEGALTGVMAGAITAAKAGVYGAVIGAAFGAVTGAAAGLMEDGREIDRCMRELDALETAEKVDNPILEPVVIPIPEAKPVTTTAYDLAVILSQRQSENGRRMQHGYPPIPLDSPIWDHRPVNNNGYPTAHENMSFPSSSNGGSDSIRGESSNAPQSDRSVEICMPDIDDCSRPENWH